jgi:hypothetical protein
MAKDNLPLGAKIIGWIGLVIGIILVIGTFIVFEGNPFSCYDADCLANAIGFMIIIIGILLIIFNSLLLKGKIWAGITISILMILGGGISFLLFFGALLTQTWFDPMAIFFTIAGPVMVIIGIYLRKILIKSKSFKN